MLSIDLPVCCSYVVFFTWKSLISSRCFLAKFEQFGGAYCARVTSDKLESDHSDALKIEERTFGSLLFAVVHEICGHAQDHCCETNTGYRASTVALAFYDCDRLVSEESSSSLRRGQIEIHIPELHAIVALPIFLSVRAAERHFN